MKKSESCLLSCVLVAVCLTANLEAASLSSGGDIAAAVANAQAGETILLGDGSYTLSAKLVVANGIRIQGTGAGKVTISVASDIKSRLMEISGGATVDGVTIQGRSLTCKSVKGKGVYITDGTLSNSRVTGFSCGQHYEHGTVCLNGANAVVSNCEIDHNNSFFGGDAEMHGGGILLESGTVTGCNIHDNLSNNGGGIYMTGGLLVDSLVTANGLKCLEKGIVTMGSGGGVWASGGIISNCTITANTATYFSGVGGLYLSGSNPTVTRTIVRDNISHNSTSAAWPDLEWSNAAVASRVTDCAFPVAFGTGCVTNMPMFADAAVGDWSLTAGSPCILADGEMGCRPFTAASPVCGFSANTDRIVAGGSVFLKAAVHNAAAAITGYSWRITDGASYDETFSGAEITPVFATPGTYSVTLTVTGGGVGSPSTRTDFIRVLPPSLTVSNVADLENAVSGAAAGQVIRVADGTYLLNKTLAIDKAITLEGVGGWTNCILKLKNGVNDRVMVIENEDAVVRGITAYNGRLSFYSSGSVNAKNASGTAVWINSRGGALVESRITKASGPSHYMQGALAVTGAKGYVNRCLIDGNTTLCQASSGNGWGGGLYICAGLVENSIFTNNTAFTGGGAYVHGGTLRNCTFYRNHGQYSGGIHANGGTVVNCVSAGSDVNTSKDSTVGRPEWGGTASGFVKCAFSGVSSLPNSDCYSIENPFVDAAAGDLNPLPGSSGLLNKGQDYLGCETAVDFAGNPRKSGSSVDIGCYEADADKFSVSINAPSAAVVFRGGTITFSAELGNPPAGETLVYAWTFTDTFNNVTNSSDVSPVMQLAPGRYTIGLRVSVAGNPAKYADASPLVNAVLVAIRDIYATAGSAGTPPFDTPEKGSSDINSLVAQLVDGATLHIGEGTFTLTDEIILSCGATITGAGWDKTILCLGNVEKRVLRLDHADAKVEKVTISGGKLNIRSDQGDGAGINVWITQNGGNLYDCRVTGADSRNHFQYGVIGVYGAAGHVARCLVDGNDNLFQDSSGDGYGTIHVRNGLVENCLVTNNTVFTGGGFHVTGGTVRNCTVFRNRSLVAGGAKATGGKIINCVFMGDTVLSSKDSTTGAPEWNGTASCFENCAFVGLAAENLPGSSSYAISDPFADSEHGNLHPVTGAQGLGDKGQDYAGSESAVDFDGAPRKSGDTVDIGCYELDAEQFGVSFDVQNGKTEGFVDDEFPFVSEVSNPPQGVSFGYSWAFTDQFGNVVTSTEANPVMTLAAGVYSVGLEVYNQSVPSQKATATTRRDFIKVSPRNLFATACNAAATYPYDTAAKGSTNILELIDMAVAGTVIHIGEGVFTNRGEMVVSIPLTITGAGMDRSTIVQVATGNRILRLDNASALCEKVALTGGRLDKRSDTQEGLGTGVWIANGGGTLRDCRVYGCKAYNYYQSGCGVSMSGDGLVERCLVECNTNAYREAISMGGGVAASKGIIRNCVIRNNVSIRGGGAYISGVAQMINCTLVGNRAVRCPEWVKADTWNLGYGGGIVFATDGAGVVKNCVFFGNTCENDSARNEWTVEKDCVVQTLSNVAFPDTVALPSAGAFSIADPMFRDYAGGNYIPVLLSPLVNKCGKDDASVGAIDFAGNRRQCGKGVDVGAYECQAKAGLILSLK